MTGIHLSLRTRVDRSQSVWLFSQQGGVYGPLPPLSVGVETIPVGVAYVFGSEMPDLFIVNNKLSTEPGMYLYEWLRTVRPNPKHAQMIPCRRVLRIPLS